MTGFPRNRIYHEKSYKKAGTDAIIFFCVVKKIKKNYSVWPTIASWYIQSMSG
jgi:uncharacterized protein YbdZ (MbtH family)